jgi:hypothetical protein
VPGNRGAQEQQVLVSALRCLCGCACGWVVWGGEGGLCLEIVARKNSKHK